MITMAYNISTTTAAAPSIGGEPYHPPKAAVPAAASAASLMLVLGAIVLWWILMRRQLRKKEKIPGHRFGSHRSHHGGSFISNSFRDSSRHGSMKDRALMSKSSTRTSSLNKKSNGHAHRHSKCTCNCGDSPLLKKHSPRSSRNSLGNHSSCTGSSPFCSHTRRYLYQASLMRDSMDSDYYADDDATHSGATSDNNICTCGMPHPPQKDNRTSKHSLPDTTVVTIEHNNNHPSQMSPDKSRRYQSKARGVKLQAMKRLQLTQPYSYDMCMCELPSTSNTQTMCMCSSSHGSLSGQQRGLSASAPNLADLQVKDISGAARA